VWVGDVGVTLVLVRDDGQSVSLGAVIARAGEGTIYEVVGQPEWVAKVFHPGLKDLAAKRAKVAAMVASPPTGAVQADGFVVLTWPRHLVDSGDGAVGYLMSRVDTTNAVEIHTLSNPVDRANPLPTAPQWTPHATWHHLVNAAANLCLAVETVHRVDAVIGDFQERNILVNDTTRVTLVDCDSMQFTDTAGHQFLCGVGRPEFTAPELAGSNLAVTARQKPSDLFALAVHIHLLLMAGNHPFLRGQWTGTGDQPDALTLARSGQWAGGPGSLLHTHPLAPPLDFLPPDIQRLFVRAFTDGATDPNRRPSATEWRTALSTIQVTSCPRGHQIPVEADPCPWCRIDDERSVRRTQRAAFAAPAAPTEQLPPQRVTPIVPGPPAGYPAPPAKRSRTPLIAAGALVAAIALGAGGYALVSGNGDKESTSAAHGSGGGGQSGGQSGSESCDGSVFTGTGSASLSADGLVVSAPTNTGCDGALTGSSVRVVVSDGSRDVAAGYFDLTAHPLAAGGQPVDFVFPAGMYWRTTDTLGSDSLTIDVTGYSRNELSAGGLSRVSATGPADPVHGGIDSTAAAALSELAAADRPYITSNLADRWVPQLSSKRLGLVTDGITYANADILRNHLELRQRYQGARLVLSNDWSTFSGPDWWVTVAGSPSDDAGPAIGWCNAQRIDSWNCLAKMISARRGPDGTTVLNR